MHAFIYVCIDSFIHFGYSSFPLHHDSVSLYYFHSRSSYCLHHILLSVPHNGFRFAFQSSLLHHKLRTYTKFLFVRHPVERLVSAYRNKLVINSTSAADFKRRYGIKILKKFRKGDAVQNISKTGHGVTFAEFVSYLIEKRHESPQSMNEHWAPYVELCHPCFIKYNIIGKYETLEEDAEYVLRKIGAPPSLHFPPLVTSKTTALVEAHMNTLTPELRKKLYNAYQLDFKLFGYDYVKEKDYVTQENGS